jgi:hypothetical protein
MLLSYLMLLLFQRKYAPLDSCLLCTDIDAWIGGKFNLDIPKFLVGAAATVEMLGGPKIAKIIVPAPPLTPDDIVGALKSRGWKADIVTSDDVASEMVPTESSGILKCVDGRGEST